MRVKAGGKEGLERRLEKEEREYIEAAQAEHNESIVLADLKLAAENARTKVCFRLLSLVPPVHFTNIISES